jgi:hypothetical protein
MTIEIDKSDKSTLGFWCPTGLETFNFGDNPK